MANAQPNDKFLVNSNGSSYYVTQANLMAEIQDNDLMLVNRTINGTPESFKITGAEVKDSFVDPIVITSVTLTNTTPTVDDVITCVVVSTGGKNPVTTYQWLSDGAAIVGATNVNYTAAQSDVGKRLSCTATVTDELGSTESKTSAETAAVLPSESVNQPTLLTPPNGAGLGPDVVTPTTDSISTVTTTGATTTVVASGGKDLEFLTEGDALMTDASGTVVSYTPTTSSISNIAGGSTIFSATNWGTAGNALDGNTTTQASSQNLGQDSAQFGVITFGATLSITKFEYRGRVIRDQNAYQLLSAGGTIVHNLQNVAADTSNEWRIVYDGPALNAASFRMHCYFDDTTGWVSDDLYAIRINGIEVTCTNITPGAVTTATGNYALDPYTAGNWTLVAGEASSSPTQPVASFANIWDDNPQSFAYFDYQLTGNQTSRYKYTFPTPIKFTKLEAWVGSYSASASAIISFNGGAGIQGGAAGALTKQDFTAEANDAPSATEGVLTSFEIGTDGANYGYLGQILVDGNPLSLNAKFLTFNDNQDFTYFKTGDIVSGRETYSNLPINVDTVSAGGPAGAFNGVFDNAGAQALDFNQALGFEFDPPLTGVVSCQMAVNNNAGTLTYVDADDAETSYAWTPNGAYTLSSNTPEPPSTIKKILWDTGQITAIEINGEVLLNDSAVKITSIDIDDNKMIVTGGDYVFYDDSQTWSDDLSTTTVGYEATKAFDGNPNTAGGVVSTNNWSMTFSGTITIPVGSILTGKLNTGPGDRDLGITAKINNVETVLRPTGPGIGIAVVTLYINSTGNPVTLTDLVFTNSNSQGQTGAATIYYLAVDDTILVDAIPTSEPTIGLSKLTLETPITGTGRVSVVSDTTDTITVLESNGRWVSSGAWNTTTKQGNAAGTNFYLTGDEVQGITVDPEDVHMTCTAFSATGDGQYKETTWQITEDDDPTFLTPVVNVTNTNETFYEVSSITPETDPVDTVSGAGTTGDPYVLTLTGNKQLTYFDAGEAVTSIGASGGSTDLHGLRFDSERATTMSYPMGIPSTNTTLSFWIKPTASSGTSRVFQDDQGNSAYSIYYNADNNTITAGNGTTFTSKSVSLNVWSNCVVTYDGTDINLYVNGQLPVTQAVAGLWTTNPFRISGNASANGQLFDGYLSDVYFVDGQLLNASVFGETNGDTQAWVPKSSTNVKAAIEAAWNTEYPTNNYDFTANWSDYLVFGADNDGPITVPAIAGFDGNTSGAGPTETNTGQNAGPTSGTITWTPPGGFSFTTSVSVYVTDALVGNEYTKSVNGVESTDTLPGTTGWFLLTSGGGTLNFIKTMRGGSNEAAFFSAIQSDNGILLDKSIADADGFGLKGFYLPFDPAATGVNYVNGMTSDSSPQSGFPITNAFDGNTDFSSTCYANNATFVQVDFTGFSSADTVKVYFSATGAAELIVNGNSIDWSGGSPVTVSVTGTGLNSVKWTQPLNTAYVGVSGIEVDGKLLVNYSSIGVDDSSNNNNFFDQGFALSSNNEMWSEMTTATGTVAGSVESIFNGYGEDQIGAGSYCKVDSDNVITFTPTTPFTNVNSFIITESSSNDYTVTFNGDSATTQTMPDGGIKHTTIPCPSTISKVEFQLASGGAGFYLSQIFINNVQLADANVQDTVLDTPATNYPVIANTNANCTTKNGNLRMSVSGASSGAGSSMGFDLSSVNTSTYYAEFNISTSTCNPGVGLMGMTNFPGGASNGAGYFGSYISVNNANYGDNTVEQLKEGDIVGISVTPGNNVSFYNNGVFQLSIPINSTTFPGIANQSLYTFGTGGNLSDTTINYGQQPFAASNATYNQATGIVTLGGTYNTTQQWSATTSTPQAHSATYLFDGTTDNGVEFGSPGLNMLTTGPVTASVLRFYQNGLQEGTFTLTINGDKTYTNSDPGYPTGWYTYNLGESITITSMQYEWSVAGGYTIAAIEADGALLVDASVYNASKDWSQEGTIVNPVGGGITATHPTYSPTNLYDGDSTTSWGAADVIKSQTGISIPFTSTFTIKISSNSNSNAAYLKIYGSNNTQRTIGNSNWWIDGTTVSEINALASGTGDTLVSPIVGFEFGSADAQSIGTYLHEFTVDGSILVDSGGGTFETLNNMESSTTVTGTVVSANPTASTLTLTSADDWTTTSGRKVTGVPGTGLNADTIYRARVRQTSQNNVDSLFSDVNRFKTATDAPPPSEVTAGGLRGTDTNQTYLNNTNVAAANKTKWTLSVWIKPTNKAEGNQDIARGGLGGNSETIGIQPSGFFWNTGNGAATLYNQGTIVDNTWTHFVVQSTDSSITFFQDGDQLVSQGVSSSVVRYLNLPGELRELMGQPTTEWFQGYTFGYYFIDNSIVAPTVFGREINNGTWVPKTGTDIAAGIKAAFDAANPPGTHNASQVWSNQWSGDFFPDYDAPSMYGVPGYGGTAALNSSITWTPPGGLEFTDTLKVEVQGTGTAGGSIVATFSDGTTTTFPSENTATSGSTVETLKSGGGTLTTLTQNTGDANSKAIIMLKWVVDDKELINGPSSGFGANGFYLPFDPAATGVNYSSYGTGTPYAPDQDWSNAFDGVISTSTGGQNFAATDGTMTWTPGTPIPVTTSVTFYVYNQTDGSTYGLKANGNYVATESNTNYGQAITKTAAELGSSLSSIQLVNSSNVGPYLTAVEVDGKLLVDYNNIGVDSSGNNNDFHDNNFVVGNTSSVWSKGATNTFRSSYPALNVFDGNLTTFANTNDSEDGSFSFGNGLTGVTSMRLFCRGTQGNIKVTLDNVQQTVTSNTDAAQWREVTVVGTQTLNLISLISSNPGLYAVEVNGVLLIDANIQDTVLDTPLTGYSVMNKGENGNLNLNDGGDNQWTSSVQSSNTGRYYAEFQFIAEGGANGSLVGIMQDASRYVVISYNGEITGAVPAGPAPTGYFNGYSDVSKHLEPGDIISVAWNLDNKAVSFYLNGDLTDPLLFDYSAIVNEGFAPNTYGYMTNGPNFGINMGQQPFVYATNNENGTATFDGTLYQVFSQPITQQAGSGRLYWDSHQGELITRLQVANRYGILPKDHAAKGIRELGSALLSRLR